MFTDIELTCLPSVAPIDCQPMPGESVVEIGEHVPNQGYLDLTVGSGYASFKPGEYVLHIHDDANPSSSVDSALFTITPAASSSTPGM